MTGKEETIIEIIAWVVLLVAIVTYVLFFGVNKDTIKNPNEAGRLVVGLMDLILLVITITLSVQKRYKKARREGVAVIESIVEGVASNRDTFSQKESVERRARLPKLLDKDLGYRGFAWALIIFFGGLSILSALIYSQQ